jgi:hypothetical protein
MTRRVWTLSLALVAIAGAGQLLGPLLASRQQQAQQQLLAPARAHQLDLAPALPPGARRRLLARMVAELARAPGPLGALRGLLRACASDPARCARAQARVGALRRAAERRLERATTLHVGLLAAVALLVVLLGGTLVWTVRARGPAVGVALAGTLVLAGGAGWHIHRVLGVHRTLVEEAQRDHWVTRTRVALALPAKRRGRALEEAARQLARWATPQQGRALRRAVRRCDTDGPCAPDVLVALGRIYGVASPSRRRVWLDRWLVWIGAVFFLVVPAAGRRREGG